MWQLHEAAPVGGDDVLVLGVEAVAHGALHHLEQSLHGLDDGLGSDGQQQFGPILCLGAAQLGCLQLVQLGQQLETVVSIQLVFGGTCSIRKRCIAICIAI